MANPEYWLWLHQAVRPASDTFARLRLSFSSPEEVYAADEDALCQALGKKAQKTVARLLDKDLSRAERLLAWCREHEVGIITFDDELYPESLREISKPPVLLFVKGEMPDLNRRFAVSVVGSRTHDDYARKMTFELAYDLALAGSVIVSGLAYGADSIAHTAAIAAKSKTVAVLGCGIDIQYPKEHAKLASMIENNGAVITEYAPGTEPARENFPARNRIISALSPVLLVTSGTVDSGTLITASNAEKQGKAIYALPGNVDNRYTEAASLLLRGGAKPAICAEDILFAYDKEYPGEINLFRLLEKRDINAEAILKAARVFSKKPKKNREAEEEGITFTADDYEASIPSKVAEHGEANEQEEEICPPPILDGLAGTVFSRIPEKGDCTPDDLAGDGISMSDILSTLTTFEIMKYIVRLPGGRIARRRYSGKEQF